MYISLCFFLSNRRNSIKNSVFKGLRKKTEESALLCLNFQKHKNTCWRAVLFYLLLLNCNFSPVSNQAGRILPKWRNCAPEQIDWSPAKSSKAHFHQSAGFNQDAISWPCFIRVVPKLEGAAEATHPLHSHSSALEMLLVPVRGRESNPGPSFLLQSLSAAERGSLDIFLMWTQTHVKY